MEKGFRSMLRKKLGGHASLWQSLRQDGNTAAVSPGSCRQRWPTFCICILSCRQLRIQKTRRPPGIRSSLADLVAVAHMSNQAAVTLESSSAPPPMAAIAIAPAPVTSFLPSVATAGTLVNVPPAVPDAPVAAAPSSSVPVATNEAATSAREQRPAEPISAGAPSRNSASASLPLPLPGTVVSAAVTSSASTRLVDLVGAVTVQKLARGQLRYAYPRKEGGRWKKPYYHPPALGGRAVLIDPAPVFLGPLPTGDDPVAVGDVLFEHMDLTSMDHESSGVCVLARPVGQADAPLRHFCLARSPCEGKAVFMVVCKPAEGSEPAAEAEDAVAASRPRRTSVAAPAPVPPAPAPPAPPPPAHLPAPKGRAKPKPPAKPSAKAPSKLDSGQWRQHWLRARREQSRLPSFLQRPPKMKKMKRGLPATSNNWLHRLRWRGSWRARRA
jgi:hypothetical protein